MTVTGHRSIQRLAVVKCNSFALDVVTGTISLRKYNCNRGTCIASPNKKTQLGALQSQWFP